MKLYHNMMEDAVETLLDEMKDTLGCCTCDQCRSDVIAYTLNQVSSRYVVTNTGHLLSRADSLRSQHTTDTHTALIKSAMLVKERPRH